MTQALSSQPTFDIHLATDRLTPEIQQELLAFGFRLDEFKDGTEGVLHKYHLSLHPPSRADFENCWTKVVALLHGTHEDDFYGYAEAEVVGANYKAEFQFQPFDTSVPLPFGCVQNVECPIGKRKSFDFHVSADVATLDPGLEAALEKELGFYHIDIQKKDGMVRVFTFQPMEVAESPRPYFDSLRDYLQKAGGMKGKLKMEATYDLKRFPVNAHVPPVVTRMPALAA